MAPINFSAKYLLTNGQTSIEFLMPRRLEEIANIFEEFFSLIFCTSPPKSFKKYLFLSFIKMVVVIRKNINNALIRTNAQGHFAPFPLHRAFGQKHKPSKTDVLSYYYLMKMKLTTATTTKTSNAKYNIGTTLATQTK